MKNLRCYGELVKIPLSLMISFSAGFGFFMRGDIFDFSLFLTAAGTLLLACGGACLNNFQDRHIDKLFSRTRHRALPSKALPPSHALILSAVLIPSGIITLYFIHHDFILPFTGIAAIIFYNGMYTPLKPRTILAILPGALCGMMPPLIGWKAAGGEFFSFKIVSVMALFGLWQFPHFWLILLNHSTEYHRAPLPNMLKRIGRFQLEKILFIWILNFAVMLIFIPILFWGNNHATCWIFSAASAALILVAGFNLFQHRKPHNYYLLSKSLNGIAFFVMLFIIFRRLI